MPSPGGSPFIPPLPDVPGGSPVRAPVIPPFSPPQQSHQGTPAYNAYLSPYGTPYAPSMTFSPPGGPPPGPSQPHTGGRGGFSSDYVGYGNSPAAPPQATPYPAAPPGGTPYHPGGQFYGGPPPQAPPAAQGWGPPMQAWAPFQYPPSTGQSYPVPLPGQPPYAFPPQQMYWPPQGSVPGPTPGYAPGPIPMMYAGPPPPMAPPAAPREPPLSRADRFDVGFVFGEGTSYGPALRPAHIQALGVHLRVNPLLKPVDDSDPEDRKSLVWNMLFSSSDCYLSGDPIHRSWTTGRDSPATFPRVTHLRLISSTFPWTVDIQATKPTAGVTCGDLIDQVFTYFHARVPQSVYDTLSREQKNAVKNIYHYNRSRADGVPGGRLGEGLKRVDWLNRATMFGGVRVNDMMVVSQLGIALPCTLEVLCQEREELDEPGPEELRARTRGRSHSRRRNSRASSTHPPPAPPSSGRSGATTPN